MQNTAKSKSAKPRSVKSHLGKFAQAIARAKGRLGKSAHLQKERRRRSRVAQAAVNQKAELKKAYGNAWEQIEKAYKPYPAMAKRIAFSTLDAARLGTLASQFVRYAEESRKPNDQRYAEFRDERLAGVKANLTSAAPIYPALEEAMLAAWLDEAAKTLGANDPFIKAALGTAKPAEVAKQLVNTSKLADPTRAKPYLTRVRTRFGKSDDPLLVLARKVEPIIRELRAWKEEKIRAVDAARANASPKRALRSTAKRLRPMRISICASLRHSRGLRRRHDARAVQDDVLWLVRPRRQLRRKAAVQPARAHSQWQSRA